ncbi:MAG: hypothetical protein H6577_11990 [Lewinellaceae bacterium]|nr:hypothetical protein [Lewinellaceae bacterium]
MEVDRSVPGSGPSIDKISDSLKNLVDKLHDHVFISAGNMGVDNFFAHTKGITVVGADKKSEYYSDPTRYSRTAYRVLRASPLDKKTMLHGTSQSTARALGYEIAADVIEHGHAYSNVSTMEN